MRILSILTIMLAVLISLQAQPIGHHGQYSFSRLEIYPSGNITISSGNSVRFTAIAYDRYNSAYTPNNLSWSGDGGQMGYDGTYTAGSYPGTFRITVRGNNVSATTQVTIRSSGPNISRVVVTPENSSVSANNTLQFSATAYDSYGRQVSGNFNWYANGGYIDQNGYYRAGSSTGIFQITARETSSNTQGTATVRVISGGYYPPHPPTPGPSNARIVITNFDAGGNVFKPTVKISAQVFGHNIQTVKLFAMKFSGAEEIDAQACTDGQSVYLHGKFERFGTSHFEVRLYDRFGNQVAREVRKE